MRAWLETSLRFGAVGFLVYACAGKSISRSHGNDDGTGTGGFGGGVGRGGAIGKGGGTVGKGGSLGKGGSVGKGGSAGKGGFPGNGGFGGKGGTAGTGNVSGESGFGGSHDDPPPGGCGGVDLGSVTVDCPRVVGCTSMLNPAPGRVSRNQIAGHGGEGGEAGQGGDTGDGPVSAASTFVCDEEADDDRSGFLAFDYYTSPTGIVNPSVALLTGSQACGGLVLGWVLINTAFELPPHGTWTSQCVAVTGEELDATVTAAISAAATASIGVRNVRFVRDCECTRTVIRYTTCGELTTPGRCNE